MAENDDDDGLAARLRAATELLESVARDRAALRALPEEERIRFINAAGDVFSPSPEDRRLWAKARSKRERAEKIRRAEALLGETGIRQARAKPVFTTPNVFPPVIDGADASQEELGRRHCYVCKQKYDQVHHFYDQLCPPCAELNLRKRTETADLRGRVALLTGGRVKIGFQAGVKLLRSGAQLIVTTRFPRDSAARYAAEPDFADWADRLEIFGLDLRHTPSVDAFCQHLLASRPRLDFIVNNACQTVRRPPAFYRHMMDAESAALASMAGPVRALLGAYEGLRGDRLLPELGGDGPPAPPAPLAGLTHAAQLSQAALLAGEADFGPHLFPAGLLDQDRQQVDLRSENSWRLRLGDVAPIEVLETHLVNAVAPFILNARLKPLLLRTPERDKHIVNVSAVEGQFYRRFKTTKHPHTNMAKAALNMMTRTSAADYHADGIHMNSVDTGWITDEDPVHLAQQKQAEHRFHPPLDIIDGAARILDPIIDGFNTGRHVHGLFLKDYRPTDW